MFLEDTVSNHSHWESRIRTFFAFPFLIKQFKQSPFFNELLKCVLRVKIYLSLTIVSCDYGSTTANNRLNNLMVLHVHKGRVDKLNLVCVVNEFVRDFDAKKCYFRKFSPFDVRGASPSETKITQTSTIKIASKL